MSAARRHGLGWHLVMALVKAWSHLIAEHRRAQPCRVLSVLRPRCVNSRRYVTVVQNGDTGKVLAMIEHRNSAALRGFLRSQPHKWRRGVKVVVTDGSKAYKSAINACLPHSRHVLDRFHVIRWFSAGLCAVRRDI